ncbi:MAG TPA: hypothetical protein VKA09_08995 [Nitrososphaeraceae archaeon]|nr:hypothetical protein [Nitrososphaeraceae archaeon]
MRKTTSGENRTESITLRVEKKVLDKLRAEATKTLKSVNVLGNQVFKFYVNWHSAAVDAGFIYVDKKNFSRIIGKLTEAEMDQILDEFFEKEFTGRIKMLTGDTELDQFLKAVEGWMWGSGFPYRHVTNNGIETYVIQHNMGNNTAYYLRGYFKRALKVMKVKYVEVRSTTDTVWLEFASI